MLIREKTNHYCLLIHKNLNIFTNLKKKMYGFDVSRKNTTHFCIPFEKKKKKKNPTIDQKYYSTISGKKPLTNTRDTRYIYLAYSTMLSWGKEERLRVDKEITEKMLENRGLMLEKKAKEINQKFETQKSLQTEADLLFKFKSLCNRIRPLRENEQNFKQKKTSE
ncbi:hypothetical protein Hanom_Chr04g00289951 [Helianthus anomalus]